MVMQPDNSNCQRRGRRALTKEEFLDGVQQEQSYYSFDSGNLHFVALDACFRSDGQPYGPQNFVWTDPNIPADELEWQA